MTDSIHDPILTAPVRMVAVQTAISPTDDAHCAIGAKRCHRMEGHNKSGYSCPVFHRSLPHELNPFRVRRLNLCRRGEERNQELTGKP